MSVCGAIRVDAMINERQVREGKLSVNARSLFIASLFFHIVFFLLLLLSMIHSDAMLKVADE